MSVYWWCPCSSPLSPLRGGAAPRSGEITRREAPEKARGCGRDAGVCSLSLTRAFSHTTPVPEAVSRASPCTRPRQEPWHHTHHHRTSGDSLHEQGLQGESGERPWEPGHKVPAESGGEGCPGLDLGRLRRLSTTPHTVLIKTGRRRPFLMAFYLRNSPAKFVFLLLHLVG